MSLFLVLSWRPTDHDNFSELRRCIFRGEVLWLSIGLQKRKPPWVLDAAVCVCVCRMCCNAESDAHCNSHSIVILIYHYLFKWIPDDHRSEATQTFISIGIWRFTFLSFIYLFSFFSLQAINQVMNWCMMFTYLSSVSHFLRGVGSVKWFLMVVFPLLRIFINIH